MKKGSLSLLTVMALTAALLVSACGGTKATTSTNPPTITTTNPPTTTTTGPTTTTGTPTTTTSGGATLPTVAIAITTHSAAQLLSYKTICLMCHGPGTSNSSPYPPTWNGKTNGSTQNTGTYTVTAGSPADHTNYTVDQCTQAGCHAAPGGSTTTTTPPTSTTTTPPTTTTVAPKTTTTGPTSTVVSGLGFVNINTDGFQPPTMTATVGTSITFTNNLEGTVELVCDALEVDQPILRGATYTYTFKGTGKFTFLTDEGMTWTITIQ
jgi:plastocyanin